MPEEEKIKDLPRGIPEGTKGKLIKLKEK